MIFVSDGVKESFLGNCAYFGETTVVYNVLESDEIIEKSAEEVFVSVYVSFKDAVMITKKNNMINVIR